MAGKTQPAAKAWREDVECEHLQQLMPQKLGRMLSMMRN